MRSLIKRHSDTAKCMRLVVRSHRPMAEILVCFHSELSSRPEQTRNSSPHTPPLLNAAEGRESDHSRQVSYVDSLLNSSGSIGPDQLNEWGRAVSKLSP